MTGNGYSVSFRTEENVLKLWGWLHSPVHMLKISELYTLKWEASMVCELYLNKVVNKIMAKSDHCCRRKDHLYFVATLLSVPLT